MWSWSWRAHWSDPQGSEIGELLVFRLLRDDVNVYRG